MRDADEAFTWEVCDHDPVAYGEANRMSTRDWLSLCIAYLRRLKATKQATQRHGRKG